MSARKQGVITPGFRFIDEILCNLLKFGKKGVLSELFKHQSVGQIVNVFTGAAKVDELSVGLSNILFDKVLDRLKIMVGDFFNFLDSLSGLVVKVVIEIPDLMFELFEVKLLCWNVLDDSLTDEVYQPLSLDFYSIPHECSLRKVLSQLRCGLRVSAIEGR